MAAIVAFALAVLGLGLGSAARADDAEDKAVAFVEKLNGSLSRDEKAPGKPVVEVRLSGTKVTDAGLKELAALTKLTRLFLFKTPVTDAGLKELAPLKALTKLDLDDTKVTDAGLKELATLTNLTNLFLTNTQVTDEGVKELQKALPKCKIVK